MLFGVYVGDMCWRFRDYNLLRFCCWDWFGGSVVEPWVLHLQCSLDWYLPILLYLESAFEKFNYDIQSPLFRLVPITIFSHFSVQFRESWVADACFWPFTPLRKSPFLRLLRA